MLLVHDFMFHAFLAENFVSFIGLQSVQAGKKSNTDQVHIIFFNVNFRHFHFSADMDTVNTLLIHKLHVVYVEIKVITDTNTV